MTGSEMSGHLDKAHGRTFDDRQVDDTFGGPANYKYTKKLHGL